MTTELTTVIVALVSLVLTATVLRGRAAMSRSVRRGLEFEPRAQRPSQTPQLAEEVRRAVASEMDRVGSFQQRIAEQLESVAAANRTLRNELAIERQAQTGEPRSLDHGQDNPLREISHSLGTPLARLRADVDLLTADPSLRENAQRRVARMALAVDLCQAFLFAFRRLGVVAETGSVFSSAKLGDVVAALGSLFSTAETPPVEIATEALPERITGYSVGFVLVALAPLIENAVEASPHAVAVEVDYWCDERGHSLVVKNRTIDSFAAEMLEREVSSKPGHDGLGLPTVRRLIGSVGGELSFDVSDTDVVSLTICLPKVEQ
jgi:signal transduction histidine kinase